MTKKQLKPILKAIEKHDIKYLPDNPECRDRQKRDTKFSLKNLTYIHAFFQITGFNSACWQRYYSSLLATSDGLALSSLILKKLPDKYRPAKHPLFTTVIWQCSFSCPRFYNVDFSLLLQLLNHCMEKTCCFTARRSPVIKRQ